MPRNRYLKGKAVFITGASIGIGRETAYKFANEKCKLVITYYTHKKEAEEVKKKCISLGAEDVLILNLNLMDDSSIKNAVRDTVDEYGHLHILINNAGIIAWKPLQKQSFEEIENQIRTNLEGLIKITREFLPYIKEMIINISSGAGKDGFAHLTTYCATKFGVRGFTQALAEEVPHLKIYSINPDMTSTRMTNFTGRPPEEVARVILLTAKGIYTAYSGEDIDVWEKV